MKNLRKIKNYKINNLKILNSKKLILENSIDNTLLTQNWNLLNKLHNQLKKIKRKIKNLESNLYDIKPKIKLLVNPKISKWYHNLPYLIYENFLVVWGLNLKTSKKIYQRVQTKKLYISTCKWISGYKLIYPTKM
jgi:uncharacterized coiled-coil protein SlyX